MSTVQELEQEVQRLKTAVSELTVLNELAVAASSTQEVDQLLDIVLKKSIRAVAAEQGSISLLTEQEDKPFKTLIRHGDTTKQKPRHRVGDHITGWVLKHKQPLMIENLAEDERFKATEIEKKELRSILCVPIWCRAKIIGILMLTNKKTGEAFTSEDLRLLSIIAPQSGQLILNSQLQEESLIKKRMEQELALARHIQMSLLPAEELVIPGFDMATYFNPAEEVGGDYYDYFMLEDDKVGIVIADVSGHGPSAAMMMTMVKGVLHSITHQFESADKALLDINSILTRIVPRSIFITMVFMVFDLKENKLFFSNAGHNPIIHFDSQTKSCRMLECRGCALNLSPDSTFLVKELSLKPNDLYFFYTDGVTEAINQDMEMFGEERLMKSIGESAQSSSEAVVAQIRSDLFGFTGEKPQSDDIVMFALKITNSV